jgi:hypothetical protein
MAVAGSVVCSSDEIQINHQTQVDSELAKHLIITSKGSFKWRGEFDSLKQFFDRVFKEGTKWSMPGGGCKQYENVTTDIRWYSTSKSLIIKGLEGDDLKTRLRALASETYEEHSNEEDINSTKWSTSVILPL